MNVTEIKARGIRDLRWCRGTELNRRHADFQPCDMPVQATDKSREAASLAGAKLD